MAKTRPYNQDCPIARTLDIVGDRWTLLIVRDLFIGLTRFSEFLKSSPGIPPKILSGRLKKLQRHSIIERRVYSEHPLRAEYTLTETGRSLMPVIHAIGEWGFEHLFEGEEELRDQVRGIVTAQVPEFQRP
ncbi:MAG: helix-turn-helix transcriptional regulator [Chloroflexi bacterium]|nr:helix-turn-helix transcriptional regulator [Chloroflexota bacterium]